MIRLLVFPLSLIISLPLSAQVKKEKDILYLETSTSKFHTLDVYYPKDKNLKKPVLIFFHGGSWKNGKKDTYRFLGKNLARKGFVAVIANYRLSPEVKIDKMTDDCSHAVRWVYDHIASYGGDPSDITLSGHSAGGQLAAIIALATERFGAADIPIKRIILIDAFGLDMVTYFQEYHNDYANSLKEVFTSNAETWKQYSPLYAIGPQTKMSFLLLTGGKTYKTITESNQAFATRLSQFNIPVTSHTFARKKHIGMILQFYCRNNKAYPFITDFLHGKR